MSRGVWLEFFTVFIEYDFKITFSKYKELDPKFVQQMLESFYVDDLVSGDDIHPCPWCHKMSIIPLIMIIIIIIIIIMIIIIINFTHIDAVR